MGETEEKENIALNIEGMTCSNCALGVSKKIRECGGEEVDVNFATGEASFVLKDHRNIKDIVKGVNSLGYKAHIPASHGSHHEHQHDGASLIDKKFWFCAVFTLPLLLHMFLPFHLLHHPIFQLVLCLPVFAVGLWHFGKSAWGSLKSGIPNMDVLITIGSSSAFAYSLAGTIMYFGTPRVHDFLFYETAATIISLVLLGNVLEHRSVKKTTSAIGELTKLQQTKAKRITENGTIEEINNDQVNTGDLLQVNTGDKVPVDGRIEWGEASVDESMITGESVPVEKSTGAKVIGGTVIQHGSIKMVAETVGSETVLSRIITMVKRAQASKPEIQQLGDKVSAIFVPVVLIIALITFLVWFFGIGVPVSSALMNAVAVLVISCPCAMGLATPTAVMVGIGRAAKNGILIKGGDTLEKMARIKNVVFDKTGTITTGNFSIKELHIEKLDEKAVKSAIFQLESHSSHPIAKSLVKELKEFAAGPFTLKDFSESRGLGISAIDQDGNQWKIGSWQIAKDVIQDESHSVYITRNDELIGWLDIQDELKPGIKQVIADLNEQGINTVLLSGDKKAKCDEVAREVGIKTVYSEQLPDQKLEIIEKLSEEDYTAMVGDGINDAPALAKATVGVSLSNATQVAIQSSQVILLKSKDLSRLLESYQLSKHSLLTIKQNLFWAFFYNVVAIPIAAMGLLNPMVAALSMAFSDVIVIGNSIRLRSKRLD